MIRAPLRIETILDEIGADAYDGICDSDNEEIAVVIDEELCRIMIEAVNRQAKVGDMPDLIWTCERAGG